MKHGWIRLFVVIFLLVLAVPVTAQEATPTGPVYIVQEGDTLWNIAARFGVTVDELMLANNLGSDSILYSGAQLIIPGLEGISGVLTTQEVPFGETLASLSLRYQTPVEVLARLNHITSPDEIYAGMSLVIPLTEEAAEPGPRLSLTSGQSLLELAILTNSNPYTLALTNSLSSTATAMPGAVLRGRGAGDPGPGALPPVIAAVGITDFTQGQTSLIRVDGQDGLSLSGSLMGHSLNFFELPEGGYVALQGVHAMADPGVYPMTIRGSLPDGTSFGFTQNVRVYAGEFLYDIPLYVAAETMDPAITGPENELWESQVIQATPEKLWDRAFSPPVDVAYADCLTSRFGSRRSYNDSEYIYFHTGLDYCGQVGHSIYAPAPGIVVYTGELVVRGNATVIDHGWGIYTGYMHQSEILVSVGDRVETGQLIGLVGNTGRVQGPHLHFEVWAGGVQVDPLEWMAQAYP
ncbi:MAG: peptidoglycan DD-metalloendopeptidase family protein [Anaerolineales bacterium]|nr:peptidoglycan DD-metalloendopeptidase family protein [Anaerolineales bacterium]